MAPSTTAIFTLLVLSLYLVLVYGHLLVSECPSGTRVCSHGRCFRKTGYNQFDEPVDETECICDPEYLGPACTIKITRNFSISQPIDFQVFSFFDEDE